MSANPKYTKFTWLVVLALLAGCNYPATPVPPPSQATPDATMTAIYSVIATATAIANQPVSPPASPTVEIPTATMAAPATLEAQATNPAPTATNTTAPSAVPASATPASTKTPVSYAGPGARKTPHIVAYYLQREPNIDGVFDEWDQDRYNAGSVVYGGGNWKGESDLSSTLMVGWDDNYLYIAARVKDDTYVQNVTGEKIFRGDSAEILLDTNVSKDFYLSELDKDDYQLGLSAGKSAPGSNPESYLWFPKGKAGSYVEVKVTGTATDNGYRLEAKIPWSVFGIKNPDVGWHFGFVFSVSDNDKSGENSQQSMVSSSANRVLTDPMTWGDLELAGKP